MTKKLSVDAPANEIGNLEDEDEEEDEGQEEELEQEIVMSNEDGESGSEYLKKIFDRAH